MASDLQIQEHVMDQLKADPFLNASEIGVAVKNGIVTLSGKVDSYLKKLRAEKAAKNIKGVKAIAEDIQIGVNPDYNKSDTEIAEAILHALKWHPAVKDENIKVKVENGNVILEGEVEWEFESTNARSAIEHLSGVRAILNLIKVKPHITTTGIQQKISAAFHRSATIDAAKVTVEVKGSKVTLWGKVRSISEKDDAARAAWNTPGVTSVDNNIEVEIPQHSFVD